MISAHGAVQMFWAGGVGVGVDASGDEDGGEGVGEGNGPELVPTTTTCAPERDARMF